MELTAIVGIDGEAVMSSRLAHIGIRYMPLPIEGKSVFGHGKAAPAWGIELACQGPEHHGCADGLHGPITIFKPAVHDRGDTVGLRYLLGKGFYCFGRDTGDTLDDLRAVVLNVLCKIIEPHGPVLDEFFVI